MHNSQENNLTSLSPSPKVKRPYRSPQLTEWGSILDLTQGAGSGTEDFPFVGGTKGV